MKRYISIFPYVLSSLSRQYSFFSTVVLTLSVTLGALFCVFSINYTLNYQSLPYKDEKSLYLAKAKIANKKGNAFALTYNYPSLVDLYKRQNAFKESAIYTRDFDVIGSLDSQPKVRLTFTTPELASLFSIPMLHGNFMSKEHGLKGFDPVAVISHRIWKTIFGARPDILSQSIRLSNIDYKIIGVVDGQYYEPKMAELGDETDIWLPWEFNYKRDQFENDWGNIQGLYYLVGSLASGVSASEAGEQLSNTANARWKEENTGNAFFDGMSVDIQLEHIRDVILGDSRAVGKLLFLGVLGLLLVAIANLSNAFISRIAVLKKELAIRATFGGKPLDLFVRFFWETLLLTIPAGLLGLFFGALLLQIVKESLLEVLPMVEMMGVNIPMVIFAFAISFIIAAFFAFLSMASIKYKNLMNSLRSSGKGMGIQVSEKIRYFLVVSQMAIAIVLIFGNFHLLNRALIEISKPIGFNIENMVGTSFFFRSDSPPDSEAVRSITYELVETLENSARVSLVSNARAPFYTPGKWSFNLAEENRQFMPLSISIDEKYLSILDLKIVAGNGISRDEIQNRAPVMLVNQSFAKILNENSEVVGSNLYRFGNQQMEIKGVVEDVAMFGEDSNVPRAYVAEFDRYLYFILKFDPEMGFSRDWLVEKVQEVHPQLSVYNFDLFKDRVNKARRNAHFLAAVTASLAILVIVLTAVGLLGLFGYSLRLRQIEMAIRASIGAKFKHLFVMLLRENLWLSALAVVISIGIIFLLSFASNKMALSLNVSILLSFVTSVAVVIGIMALACAAPLYRLNRKQIINTLKGGD